MVASATTTKRLTAHPCAATKEPKDETHEERNPVAASGPSLGPCRSASRRGPASNPVPATPAARPSRQEDPTAHRRTIRPEAGRGVRPLGQGDEDARGAVEEDGARAPRRARSHPGRRCRRRPRRRPRPRDPSRPWPRPPSRDHRPRGATSSQRPSPTWIQTVAAAAWTGWSDQMVTPLLTRCWTQPGDVAGRRLDHARRQPEGHGRLDLQQPVEDPEGAEADPEDPPRRRLGQAVAPGRGNAS